MNRLAEEMKERQAVFHYYIFRSKSSNRRKSCSKKLSAKQKNSNKNFISTRRFTKAKEAGKTLFAT